MLRSICQHHKPLDIQGHPTEELYRWNTKSQEGTWKWPPGFHRFGSTTRKPKKNTKKAPENRPGHKRKRVQVYTYNIYIFISSLKSNMAPRKRFEPFWKPYHLTRCFLARQKMDFFRRPGDGGLKWHGCYPGLLDPRTIRLEDGRPQGRGTGTDGYVVGENHHGDRWLWDPLQMPFLWLINGGDPNYLLTGMILQVGDSSSNWWKRSGDFPLVNERSWLEYPPFLIGNTSLKGPFLYCYVSLPECNYLWYVKPYGNMGYVQKINQDWYEASSIMKDMKNSHSRVLAPQKTSRQPFWWDQKCGISQFETP